MKVLAFITLFVIVTMFAGTVSAVNYNINLKNSVPEVINNTYNNDTITVKDNNISLCIPSKNSDVDASQLKTAGIVITTTDRNCGPTSLATVLSKMGINTTQEELATLARTDENGTTMYGLIQAAKAKGLIAKGLKLPVDQLRHDNIVFLTSNGEGHYSIVLNITNTTVYLEDTKLRNMTLEYFTAVYSGNVIVVTDDTNNTQLNNTVLTTEETQNIKGTFLGPLIKVMQWVITNGGKLYTWGRKGLEFLGWVQTVQWIYSNGQWIQEFVVKNPPFGRVIHYRVYPTFY